MKFIRLLILTALLVASCRTLPAINPSVPDMKIPNSSCLSPFLKEPYRLVHAIEFSMAGKPRGAVIGVTAADPSTRSISCAIMTAEGMVLFEAESGATLKVARAMPPFDARDFARNLIEDIELIFFAPPGGLEAEGTFGDGAKVCRWRSSEGGWIDAVIRKEKEMEIDRYSSFGMRKRHVRITNSAENVYQNIELTAEEMHDYSLKMILLEAEPLEGESNVGKKQKP